MDRAGFLYDGFLRRFPYEPTSCQDSLMRDIAAFLTEDDGDILVVNGYAGTGKTTVVGAVISLMGDLKTPCVLLAPTGRAAKVLSAYTGRPAFTVHKHIYRQKSHGDDGMGLFSLAPNKAKNTLFIVDEVSLIGIDEGTRSSTATFGSGNLLEDLILFLRNGTDCRMILIGDAAQLPPIGLDCSPALSREYMAGAGGVRFSELRTVVRQQAGSGILANATRIRELVEEADSDTKEEIQMLIDGKTIEKPVHEDITYEDIHKSKDNLWNFLFFTGYLKVESKRFEDRRIYLTMSIPNDEVLTIYEDTIKEWFDRQVKTIDFQPFYQAVVNGDVETMEEFLSGLLEKSISYYDNKEAFYHGVMVGLFGGLSGYEIKSNREYGKGRPDLVLSPYNPRKSVIIFEFKSCKKYTQMAEGCRAALDQIEERDYAVPFLDKGYTKIMNYGICFCEKTCMVEMR